MRVSVCGRWSLQCFGFCLIDACERAQRTDVQCVTSFNVNPVSKINIFRGLRNVIPNAYLYYFEGDRAPNSNRPTTVLMADLITSETIAIAKSSCIFIYASNPFHLFK